MCSCPLCALVLHVPHVPRALVVSSSMCLVPYKISCPRSSRVLRASYPTCFRVVRALFPSCSRSLCASCLVFSCASRDLCPVCSQGPSTLCPMCLHPFWALFPYVILKPRTFSILYANITFCVLAFQCLTLLHLPSFSTCEFFEEITQVRTIWTDKQH